MCINCNFHILLAISAVCAASHAGTFRFRCYEVADGLSSNTVRSIIQDSRGFMWFGTKNGLSRFDGRSFKNFRSVYGDSASLGNNHVYALYEDRQGRLWTGTEGGVYIYDPGSEHFSFFSAATSDGTTVRSHITNLAGDEDKNIWISTYTQGVFRYNPEENTLCRYSVAASAGTRVSNIYDCRLVKKQ